jgi:NADH-quinone oxidoreductase subunit M
MIILGAIKFNTAIGVLAGASLIIGVCYMLWMFQRVFFETTKPGSEQFKDLTLIEGVTFLPVIILIIVMGIYPQPFLSKITPSTALQFSGSTPVVAQVPASNVQAPVPGLTIEQK